MKCVISRKAVERTGYQVDEEAGDGKESVERSFDVAGVTDERFLELNFSVGESRK